MIDKNYHGNRLFSPFNVGLKNETLNIRKINTRSYSEAKNSSNLLPLSLFQAPPSYYMNLNNSPNISFNYNQSEFHKIRSMSMNLCTINQ